MSHAHTPAFGCVFDGSVLAFPWLVSFIGSTKDNVFTVCFMFQAVEGAEVSPRFLGLVMDERQVSVLTTSWVGAFMSSVGSHKMNGSLTGMNADMENDSS